MLGDLIMQKFYSSIIAGSGSYIIQVLFGMLFGASYLAKVYWGRIKSFFSKSPAEEISSDSKDD